LQPARQVNAIVSRLRPMTEYPPKLVKVTDCDFGALLTLSDGRTLPINIRSERLNRAFREYERPSLGELLTSRSLTVFADTWQTPDADWDRVRRIILAHRWPRRNCPSIPASGRCSLNPPQLYGNYRTGCTVDLGRIFIRPTDSSFGKTPTVRYHGAALC
jgi:hypothetical protein